MDEKPKVIVEREVIPKDEGPVLVAEPEPPAPEKEPSKFSPEVEAEISKRVGEREKIFVTTLVDENKRKVEKLIDDFRAKIAPPTPEEIQKLLDAEYIHFTVKVPFNGTEREFTLVELPQAVEKKFYAIIKDKFVPTAQNINAVRMNLLDGGDIAKKILTLTETVEPLMDVMCSCAALTLNPRGEDKEITDTWVRDNLSSWRILSIVTAQSQCNRMRDFFSSVSRAMSVPT